MIEIAALVGEPFCHPLCPSLHIKRDGKPVPYTGFAMTVLGIGHFAVVQKTGEVQLAQGFIYGDRHGIA